MLTVQHQENTLSVNNAHIHEDIPASLEKLLNETLKRMRVRRKEQESNMLKTVHEYALKVLKDEVDRCDSTAQR